MKWNLWNTADFFEMNLFIHYVSNLFHEFEMPIYEILPNLFLDSLSLRILFSYANKVLANLFFYLC